MSVSGSNGLCFPVIKKKCRKNQKQIRDKLEYKMILRGKCQFMFYMYIVYIIVLGLIHPKNIEMFRTREYRSEHHLIPLNAFKVGTFEACSYGSKILY
jgi:hypothetical protein